MSAAPDVPTLDYEVAELTWENGQPAMHGLGPSRVSNKQQGNASSITQYTWDKPRAAETLEAIVNQATLLPHHKLPLESGGEDLVPWLNRHCTTTSPARISATMTMDALVPSSNTRNEEGGSCIHLIRFGKGNSGGVVGCSTLVGCCSGDDRRATARADYEWSSRDSGSATFGIDSSRQVTVDTCGRELGVRGFMSTSMGSPGNTSSGQQCTKLTIPDVHDSVCHSKPQKGKGKSSISTKRSRAAAIHNQSERKRRDKINQRMKTLEKLVPNSSKTDKASMLDEVIEYLKQLQAQVQMMSQMNMSPMMLTLAMQQQFQMSIMNPMGMGMGMGVMDLNTIGQSNIARISPVLHPSAFMPLVGSEGHATADRLHAPPPMTPDPLSAFLACQSQPMTMDAYSRMAALFQQMHHQPPGPGPKN